MAEQTVTGICVEIAQKPELRRKFWDRASVGGMSECWQWRGSCNKLWGYGRIFYNGTSEQAHRFAYRLLVGPIPEGMCVLHRCDNPPCVNPRHLFLGTQAENAADRTAKGRSARGERNSKAKLTQTQVGEIRSKLAEGQTPSALGREYGVSHVAIGHIKRGRNWSWLNSK